MHDLEQTFKFTKILYKFLLAESFINVTHVMLKCPLMISQGYQSNVYQVTVSQKTFSALTLEVEHQACKTTIPPISKDFAGDVTRATC